jgi:hypothetical protein
MKVKLWKRKECYAAPTVNPCFSHLAISIRAVWLVGASSSCAVSTVCHFAVVDHSYVKRLV